MLFMESVGAFLSAALGISPEAGDAADADAACCGCKEAAVVSMLETVEVQDDRRKAAKTGRIIK